MRLKCFSILFLPLMITGCSKQTLDSRWHAPAKEDVGFRFYHADSKIRYNISNDSTHLYLSMDVSDPLTMMKILQAGMRLFLGDDAKRKERNELQFPIYVDRYELTDEDLNPSSYALDRKGQLERMLPTEGYLKHNGSVKQVFNGAPLDDGTQVHIRLDNDRALVYEAIIPLALLNSTSGKVALGVETGAFKFPTGGIIQQNDITSGQQMTAGDRAMGREQGMMGGMGGMDPYGMNQGMNSPTGSANMGMNQRAMTRYNALEEAVRFWMNVQLSAPAQ